MLSITDRGFQEPDYNRLSELHLNSQYKCIDNTDANTAHHQQLNYYKTLYQSSMGADHISQVIQNLGYLLKNNLCDKTERKNNRICIVSTNLVEASVISTHVP